MAAKTCEPNTVVICVPIGEWIVSDCFVACCKTWQSLFLTKKCVIYTTKLAWSRHDLSKVTWYDNKIRASLFSKSSFARLQEFWNSSICLYEIKRKNLSQSTCPTGSFTCPGPSGSGKRRALKIGMASTPALRVWSQPLPEIRSRLCYARSETRYDAHCHSCRFYTRH